MGGGGTFRQFEHTADLGIEVEAKTLAELFEAAGRALFSLMVDPSSVSAREARRISAQGEDEEELLRAWLHQLLLAFAIGGFVAREVEVERIDRSVVEGTIRGEPYREGRHRFEREIKGVTYHGLTVEEASGKWMARVIFDV